MSINLEAIQPTEVIAAVMYDKANKLGTIEYIDDLKISNGATKKALRAGQGNAIVYSISSEFSSAFTATCLLSVDLFKAYVGADPIVGQQKFTTIEEIVLSGTTGSVAQTPVSGGKFDLFVMEDGKRSQKLELGSPTSTPNTYSITGKSITVNSAQSGKILKVVYEYEKEGLRFRKYNVDTETFKLIGLGKAVDISSPNKTKHVGQMVIPSMKINSAFDISMSNNDFVKCTLEGECLAVKEGDKTYSWDFIIEG